MVWFAWRALMCACCVGSQQYPLWLSSCPSLTDKLYRCPTANYIHPRFSQAWGGMWGYVGGGYIYRDLTTLYLFANLWQAVEGNHAACFHLLRNMFGIISFQKWPVTQEIESIDPIARHVPDICTWASFSTSLCLSFLTCKVKTI